MSSDADDAHARAVFNTSAQKLVTQAISNARIQATNEWLRKFEGQNLAQFRSGSDTYLTEEQYAQVKHIGLHLFVLLAIFTLF